MDFGLSEAQQLLEKSVQRFLAERLPVATVRKWMAADSAARKSSAEAAEAWRAFAELGAAGCLVPEQHGGAGLALLDAAVIAGALGRGAAPLPFLGAAVLAPLLLRELPQNGAEGASLAQEWLPKLAAGEARLTAALPQNAGPVLKYGRLHGEAAFVPDAEGADALLIAAAGGEIALLPADAAGLEIRVQRTIDSTRNFCALRFNQAQPAAVIPDAAAASARAADAARIAVAADAIGCCDSALHLAVQYAGQREQFGRPIAGFQAVKHMCAEMAAALEPARALLWHAAHAWDSQPKEAPLLAALCKAHTAEVAQALVRQATEVHGGIGFTDEYDLHLWFKRAGLSRQLYGAPESLRARAAAMQGFC